MHEEVKLLGFHICAKTKVQVFGGLLDKTIKFVHACGEDIEILENFTQHSSGEQNDGRVYKEVLCWNGLVHRSIIFQHKYMAFC